MNEDKMPARQKAAEIAAALDDPGFACLKEEYFNVGVIETPVGSESREQDCITARKELRIAMCGFAFVRRPGYEMWNPAIGRHSRQASGGGREHDGPVVTPPSTARDLDVAEGYRRAPLYGYLLEGSAGGKTNPLAVSREKRIGRIFRARKDDCTRLTHFSYCKELVLAAAHRVDQSHAIGGESSGDSVAGDSLRAQVGVEAK